MPIILNNNIPRSQRKMIQLAFAKAEELRDGLDSIPSKSGGWFRSKTLQKSFASFFGEHSLKSLANFRNKIADIDFEYDTIIVRILNRRDSLDPQYNGVDLTNVHADSSTSETDKKVHTICIGERFFSSDLKTQVLTILHEMTHLFLNTEDFDFGSNTTEQELFTGAKEIYNGQAAIPARITGLAK